MFAGTFEQGSSGFKRAIAENERIVYLSNLLHKRPVFPHGKLYRNAILSSIDGHALARLHDGPEIFVLISSPPRWASARIAFVLGMVAVGWVTCNRKAVHSRGGYQVGFKPLCLSVRECATPAELAALIMASSCVPPLTPQDRRNGKAIMNGGLVSNVPVDAVARKDQQTLVLLTWQFPKLPTVAGCTYVQPSQSIPARFLDYINDAALQATFDLGCRADEQFCSSS